MADDLADRLLTRARDHAAHMATALHTPDCPPPNHHGACPGCVTDADRALWRQLADELTAHLNRRHHQETLL